MKIQELERKTGLERPSIRFYEKEGLLSPKRLENGYREYSEADVELLKKIKLLRQLGLSIEKIRQLQQGSEDLSAAIAHQAAWHSSQIDEHRRCRAVCEAIHADGAVFSTLDAEHYLKLLREISIDDRALGRRDFQEKIEKEIHPWRRFFARCLDYGLWNTIIRFLYIVILRVRPLPGDFGGTLITIAAMALFIPVEALLISNFGTTPGKFAMGIRLQSIQGGNLSRKEALCRSCNVYVRGCGCGIPLLEPVMKLVHYCQLTGRALRRFARYDQVEGPQDMVWDEETEIIYRDVDYKRGAVVAVMLVLTLGIGIYTGFDGIRPKYRGNELTIQQFSENYNAFLQLIDQPHEEYEELEADGTWKQMPQNTIVVNFNDDRSDHRMEFVYTLEGEYIREVSIHHDWNRVSYLGPIDNEPYKLVCSILLAQEGCGFRELKEFSKLYQMHMFDLNATIEYKNIVVAWNILTDVEMVDGVLIFNGEDNPSAELEFTVTIK